MATIAPKTDAQKNAQKAYMSKFVRVEIRMDADKKETVESHAEARGESVNAFVNRAIDETIARDNEAVSGK